MILKTIGFLIINAYFVVSVENDVNLQAQEVETPLLPTPVGKAGPIAKPLENQDLNVPPQTGPMFAPPQPMITPETNQDPIETNQMVPTPENSDLKTDSSHWWKSYYTRRYPRYYSYYRPSVYTYYYYPVSTYTYPTRTYTYWHSYW